MVQLVLQGWGGDRRNNGAPPTASPHGIECYHVNAQVSDEIADVGSFRLGKAFRLLGFCLQAIWCRFRFGVKNFYYVPAPGKRSAVYRDWLVLLLCRPFFSRLIFHWHAAGLGDWLEAADQRRLRSPTRALLGNADLSIVLSSRVRMDPEKLSSRRIEVIPYGIPDPCPEFERDILPGRRERSAARAAALRGESPLLPETPAAGETLPTFNILFVAHCTRDKGLFDTLDAVALANARLQAARTPLEIRLTVAGEFLHAAERAEFAARISQADLQSRAGHPCVAHVGFVAGPAKRAVFAASDCFCFPTYYSAESFPLVVVEAMAFGLPIVTTRWRSLPEMLPPDYPSLVAPQAPREIAATLLALAASGNGEELRAHFLRRFTLERQLADLAAAIRAVAVEN